MRVALRLAAVTLCLIGFATDVALAQNQPPPGRNTYSSNEIIDAGHFTWEDAADEYATLVGSWWTGADA